MNKPYPKGYCAIKKENGHKHGDVSLAKAIVIGCSTAYADCTKKVDQQIEWVIANYDNVNDVCLCNALELVWYYYIGVATNELFNYMAESVALKVIEGKVKEW